MRSICDIIRYSTPTTMTRSKIAKKIIKDPPDEVREQVRAYGDAIVMIKEIWELWESMAECGELHIGPQFSANYKRLKAQVKQLIDTITPQK